MEYTFVHTNATSIPQNKVAIIIREYEGDKVDWGIITSEGIRATLESFQSGRRLLPCDDSLPHNTLPTSFDVPSSRPHLSTTTTEAAGENIGIDPGRMGRSHTHLTSLGRSESYSHPGTTPVGDKAVNVEVQATFVMKKNLCMSKSKIRTEREREGEIGTKKCFIPIATVTNDKTNLN